MKKYETTENPIVGASVYRGAFDATKFLSILESSCGSTQDPLLWEDSYIGPQAGQVSDYRTSVNCSLDVIMSNNSKHQLRPELLSIKEKIDMCVGDYANQYRLSIGIHEPYQVLKYSEGAHYRAHHDRSKENGRTVSVVASLQAPEEGGELEFPFFDYTFKATTGSLIVFPSTHPYTHIAHPVTKGLKYSLVTWYI